MENKHHNLYVRWVAIKDRNTSARSHAEDVERYFLDTFYWPLNTARNPNNPKKVSTIQNNNYSRCIKQENANIIAPAPRPPPRSPSPPDLIPGSRPKVTSDESKLPKGGDKLKEPVGPNKRKRSDAELVSPPQRASTISDRRSKTRVITCRHSLISI